MSNIKRCCKTCKNYIEKSLMPQQEKHILDESVAGICYEGGFSEIAHPEVELSEEDCSAWLPTSE